MGPEYFLRDAALELSLCMLGIGFRRVLCLWSSWMDILDGWATTGCLCDRGGIMTDVELSWCVLDV